MKDPNFNETLYDNKEYSVSVYLRGRGFLVKETLPQYPKLPKRRYEHKSDFVTTTITVFFIVVVYNHPPPQGYLKQNVTKYVLQDLVFLSLLLL